MFERNQKIIIEFLLFAASLMLKSFALFNRIILLGVTGRNFLTVNATFKNFNATWIIRRNFCQRNKFFWQVRHKSWLN